MQPRLKLVVEKGLDMCRLTDIIAIQVHLVAESCTICSSRSRQPAWKLLDTPSQVLLELLVFLSTDSNKRGNRTYRTRKIRKKKGIFVSAHICFLYFVICLKLFK